jgi:hypothetical protein
VLIAFHYCSTQGSNFSHRPWSGFSGMWMKPYVMRCRRRTKSEKWIWTYEEMVINDPRRTFV